MASKKGLVTFYQYKYTLPNYYEIMVPKMNKGGIILSDHVLWNGKTLELVHPNDVTAKVFLGCFEEDSKVLRY
ncbi:hypothetical protein [Flavobacterium lipolyticum]|uniref:Uncharacterized protein n=1 Tax=Flavobacterium lipolyticum TaxID=2893754 RepID=A0ABS8M180_9FLAO|nr:hypothetical protein [Flavobacterium sp. F-126]MCC9018573.1 hypothetical protein [Flavobacterium sp. F-126]